MPLNACVKALLSRECECTAAASQPARSPRLFAAENSHIVLPRICMKYQNIFCRLRIRNNVCITVWGRSQACGRQAEWYRVVQQYKVHGCRTMQDDRIAGINQT